MSELNDQTTPQPNEDNADAQAPADAVGVAPIDPVSRCYATDRDLIKAMLDKAKAAPHVGLVLLSATKPRVGGGKKPTVRNWNTLTPQTLTESSLIAFEKQALPWNIGLRLDTLVVLDRDRRNDPEGLSQYAEERWAAELARARSLGAPIIKSGGGGEHIYYLAPTGAAIHAKYLRHHETGQEIGGLEVKHGPNAQMVIPPSVHQSGQYYEVLSPVNATPLDFLDLLIAKDLPVVPEDLLRELTVPSDARMTQRTAGAYGAAGAAYGAAGAAYGAAGAAYGARGGRPRKEYDPVPPSNLDDEQVLALGRAAFVNYALTDMYPGTGLPTIRGERNNALYRLVLIAREFGAPDDPQIVESWLLDLPGYQDLKAEEPDKCAATIRSACAREVVRGRRHPAAERAAPSVSGLDRLPTNIVEWMHFNKDGSLRKTIHNLQCIIRYDPVLQACIRQELFAPCVTKRWLFKNPWEALTRGLEHVEWEPFSWDASYAAILAYLSSAYGLDFQDGHTKALLKQEYERKLQSRGVIFAQQFLNKAAEHFKALVERHHGDEAAAKAAACADIDAVFAGLYRALKLMDEPQLTATALRMHLQASLKRIQITPKGQPVKHDYCIVLRGMQGAKKSTAIQHLSIFYADPEARESAAKGIQTLTERIDMDDANGYQFVVLEELTALKAAQFVHENRAKDFITRTDHTINPKYRDVKTEPRRFVLWGTTNDDDFLTDPTGNRRYWVFSTSGTSDDPIDVEWIDLNHERIWTAVALAEHIGLRAYPNAQQEAQLMEIASFYLNQSTATAQLEQWFAGLTQAQLRDLHNHGITIADLIVALTNDPEKSFDPTLQRQLARALKAAGWFKDQRRQQGSRAWRWFPPVHKRV